MEVESQKNLETKIDIERSNKWFKKWATIGGVIGASFVTYGFTQDNESATGLGLGMLSMDLVLLSVYLVQSYKNITSRLKK